MIAIAQNRILAGLAVLAPLGVVLACGDDSPGIAAPGGADGSSPTADGTTTTDGPAPLGPGTPAPAGSGAEFCQKTIGSINTALQVCCTPDDKMTAEYGLLSALLTPLVASCGTALETSIAKGRVLRRTDQFDGCLATFAATYSATTCANITKPYSDTFNPDCHAAFVGVGAVGAPCIGKHECTDGLTCVEFTPTQDGTCKPPPQVGEPCGAARSDGGTGLTVTSINFGEHPPCVTGARCDSSTRKCVKAAAEGESCTDDDICAAPLRCVLGKCGPNGPGGAGSPCLEREDCLRGFYCAQPEAGAQGTCAEKKVVSSTCMRNECYGRCNAPAGQAGTCVSFCGSP